MEIMTQGRSRLFSVVSWGRGRRNLCNFRNVAMGLCLLRELNFDLLVFGYLSFVVLIREGRYVLTCMVGTLFGNEC